MTPVDAVPLARLRVCHAVNGAVKPFHRRGGNGARARAKVFLIFLEARLPPSSRKAGLRRNAVTFPIRQARKLAAERDEIAVAHFDTAPVAQV